MVVWDAGKKSIILRYGNGTATRKNLNKIPFNERKYKCYDCFKILSHDQLIDKNGELVCPICGQSHYLELMCPLDHSHCSHEKLNSLAICPICGDPICPECGSHDVIQVSRVTGYLADVAGWNAGKRQELKDRMRYDVAVPEPEPDTSRVMSEEPGSVLTEA